MHFRITGDVASESGLAPIITEMSGATRQYFLSKDYGIGLLGIVVVLMCQDQDLKLKRRVRFARNDKKLYLDIMLDLDQMKRSDPKLRKRIVAERLIDEVPQVLGKYSLSDFNMVRFMADLNDWSMTIGN